MVGRVFEFTGRTVFDGQLDAALALMGVPDAVVETKLHFLFDVAGEVVGRDPAGVNIESGLTAVGVGVDHLQLNRVPGRSVRGSDEAALAGGADAGQARQAGAPKVKSMSLT